MRKYRANTGSLASQFMKGAVSKIANLSRGDFRVRTAITPGTAQSPAIPPETINDIIEQLCRPKNRNTRSRMKAKRARYPESSRKAMPKNMNIINGTKPSTSPTPSMTPEMIKDLSHLKSKQAGSSGRHEALQCAAAFHSIMQGSTCKYLQ